MLQKEGKKNKQFQNRWFVLVGGKVEDGGAHDQEFDGKRYLLYYETSASNSAKGCVCLKDGQYEVGQPKKARKDFSVDQVSTHY